MRRLQIPAYCSWPYRRAPEVVGMGVFPFFGPKAVLLLDIGCVYLCSRLRDSRVSPRAHVLGAAERGRRLCDLNASPRMRVTRKGARRSKCSRFGIAATESTGPPAFLRSAAPVYACWRLALVDSRTFQMNAESVSLAPLWFFCAWQLLLCTERILSHFTVEHSASIHASDGHSWKKR